MKAKDILLEEILMVLDKVQTGTKYDAMVAGGLPDANGARNKPYVYFDVMLASNRHARVTISKDLTTGEYVARIESTLPVLAIVSIGSELSYVIDELASYSEPRGIQHLRELL